MVKYNLILSLRFKTTFSTCFLKYSIYRTKPESREKKELATLGWDSSRFDEDVPIVMDCPVMDEFFAIVTYMSAVSSTSG